MDGKIVATKWFGDGEKEHRKAIIWEEETMKRLAVEAEKMIPTDLPSPLDWANDCLSDVKRRCSTKTYDEKRRVFLMLLAFAGDKPLSDFIPRFALSYLQKQFDTRSGYAANKDRKNLATAWEWGRKYIDGFPDHQNPFRAVERFPEKRQPRYVPPEADFWRVYELTTGQDRVMLTAFLHLGGPRRGEIFSLKWFDVDFSRAQVRLTTKKTRNGSERINWIPMSRTLKRALLSWWEERPFKQSEYVFTMLDNGVVNSGHNPGDPFKVRQHFLRRLCERAGVNRFQFHAIRHLSAVILYKEGEAISTIQQILRHEHATTTDRYLRSLGLEPGRLQRAVDVFNERGPAKIIAFPEMEKAL
ncbi:MAG: site-specific integrase [Desulfobacteraceae bacterium]|nr:site-specific integrase [Desulfobacteraceae bacterium]